MVYSVKEIYLTVQGEGAQMGRTAVFLRFAGCNLWSGLEKDRKAADCQFCDTDFIGTNGPGGGKFEDAEHLAKAVSRYWPGEMQGNNIEPWVICTGGEPLLQLDEAAISALQKTGFKVAVETNGTIKASYSLDWICVSPKANIPLVQTSGNELKLVYPQAENSPSDFEMLDFDHFFLQPLDPTARGVKHDKEKAALMHAAYEYCLKHPQWRLSVQTHKAINVP